LGRAASSSLAVHQAMQRQPIATSTALVKATGLTAATVNKSLAHLERLRVVAELTNRQRGRVFAYRRYVDELAAELERVL
jgi:Fic family protein